VVIALNSGRRRDYVHHNLMMLMPDGIKPRAVTNPTLSHTIRTEIVGGSWARNKVPIGRFKFVPWGRVSGEYNITKGSSQAPSLNAIGDRANPTLATCILVVCTQG
jgi:hypothetical protein